MALGFGDTFFEEAQMELDARSGLDFTAGSRVVPAGPGR